MHAGRLPGKALSAHPQGGRGQCFWAGQLAPTAPTERAANPRADRPHGPPPCLGLTQPILPPNPVVAAFPVESGAQLRSSSSPPQVPFLCRLLWLWLKRWNWLGRGRVGGWDDSPGQTAVWFSFPVLPVMRWEGRPSRPLLSHFWATHSAPVRLPTAKPTHRLGGGGAGLVPVPPRTGFRASPAPGGPGPPLSSSSSSTPTLHLFYLAF